MNYNIRLSTVSSVRATLVALGLVVSVSEGCGGSGGRFVTAESGGAAGSTNGGGSAIGGSSNATGGDSNGGASATGGAAGSGTAGGANATGGSVNSGGASSTGGLASTGGSVSTVGGATATGGTLTTAGTPSTGGASLATGGTMPTTGGAPGTGGVTSTGNAPSTGGNAATGGTSATQSGSLSTGGTMPTGGATSTGASAATGGSSGIQHCTPATMIDDMEDGNGSICPNQGRVGGWYTAAGKCESIVPAPNTVLNATLIPGGRGSSLYAMHFTGTNTSCSTGNSDYWSVLGVSLAPDSGPHYDASQFNGIRFWAKTDSGNLKFRVNIETTASRSQTDGGACIPQSSLGCADHYGAFVSVTNGWQQFSIDFNYMTQEGWGVVTAKDLAHVWDIAFLYGKTLYDSGTTTTNPDNYSLWVDDVEFW